MKNILNQIEIILPFESWILQIALVLIFALILNLTATYFLNYAKKVSNFTKNFWDDALIKAANPPLSTTILIIAAKICSDILAKHFQMQNFNLIIYVKISIIITLTWFLLRFINFLAQEYLELGKVEQSEFEHTTIDALTKLGKITVVVFAILLSAHTLGFSISAILAAGGAGGLVIGFAAKDLLANLFGGLTIYLDRPFNVGDWIRCDEKNIEGTVEYIGWRHTRIRGFNKNPIYVPNAIFTTVVVENPSRMTHRRIKESIGLRYCDLSKMTAITNEVKEMLDSHPSLDHELEKVVNFEKFNVSSVDFLVYTFTKTTKWSEFYKIKQEILLKIAEIISKHSAEIAFQTQTIYMKKQNSAK